VIRRVGIYPPKAVGIAWDHLDLSSAVLLVRQSNGRGKLLTVKSKASVRDLPLPPVDMLNIGSGGGPMHTGCYLRTRRASRSPVPISERYDNYGSLGLAGIVPGCRGLLGEMAFRLLRLWMRRALLARPSWFHDLPRPTNYQ
jgi:hypothetical protein